MKNKFFKIFQHQLFFYRLQQLLILGLHLILLYWMYYALSNTGSMTTLQTFYHFFGMSVMGAGLIRGTAWWAQYHYVKEQQNEIDHESLETNLNEKSQS